MSNLSHLTPEVEFRRLPVLPHFSLISPQIPPVFLLDAPAGWDLHSPMKMKLLLCVIAAGLTGLLAGCVKTVNDQSQFGIPFLKDDAEGQYERSVPEILDAARAVINADGELTSDNSVNHSLVGRVNDTTVYIRVDEVDVTKPVSHVVVQARTRGGAADADLAHQIEKEIALKLVH